MTNLVDPIKLLIEKASAPGYAHKALSAESMASELPYEVALEPPVGVKVQRLTVASTYRTPIPVLYDPSSKTTFPIPNRG